MATRGGVLAFKGVPLFFFLEVPLFALFSREMPFEDFSAVIYTRKYQFCPTKFFALNETLGKTFHIPEYGPKTLKID